MPDALGLPQRRPRQEWEPNFSFSQAVEADGPTQIRRRMLRTLRGQEPEPACERVHQPCPNRGPLMSQEPFGEGPQGGGSRPKASQLAHCGLDQELEHDGGPAPSSSGTVFTRTWINRPLDASNGLSEGCVAWLGPPQKGHSRHLALVMHWVSSATMVPRTDR